jgi:hypothetical protein
MNSDFTVRLFLTNLNFGVISKRVGDTVRVQDVKDSACPLESPNLFTQLTPHARRRHNEA